MDDFSDKKVVVCFVKTPSFTPLKTRLAASIGKNLAEEFYRLSVKCIEETLLGLQPRGFYPIWAVAEREAQNFRMWDTFPRIWQGDGDLGDRLAKIEEHLSCARKLYFIGGDAPQISIGDFELADKLLDQSDYALGPSKDGGYWIFAGNKKVGAETWKQVPYSCTNTFSRFFDLLSSRGHVGKLPLVTDVDYEQDLVDLIGALKDQSSPAKDRLKKWLKSFTNRL